MKHPLESNKPAREYFAVLAERANKGPLAAWREAVEACTGSLPTWAARALPRRDKRVTVASYRARA